MIDLTLVRQKVAAIGKDEPDNVTPPWKRFYKDRVVALAGHCCANNPGDLIEVGCLGGATTVELAAVARTYGRQLYAVDNWLPGGDDKLRERVFPNFLKEIDPFRDVVQVCDMDAHGNAATEVYIRNHFAFAFVDDGHRYPQALYELLCLMPQTSGMIVVDDIHEDDIKRAIKSALKAHPAWREFWCERTDESYLYRIGND